MIKVKVHWEISQPDGWESFSLEELGVNTLEEWESLDVDNQEEKIQELLDRLDIAYPCADNWSTEEV